MRFKKILLFCMALVLMSCAVNAATFEGYYNVSQNLSSGQSIPIPNGSVRVEGSVAGVVPEYTAWDKNNISTYPSQSNISFTGGFDTPYVSNVTVAGNSITPVTIEENGSFTIFSVMQWSIGESLPSFIIPLGDSSTTAMSIYTRGNSNNVGQYRPFASPTTTYQSGNTDNLYDGAPHDVIITTADIRNFRWFIDGADVTLASPHVSPSGPFTLNNIGRGYNSNTYNWIGNISNVVMWNSSLTDAQLSFINNGFSGIQLSGQPYLGGTQQLNVTGDEVEYVATDGIARVVSTTSYFEDNVTIDNQIVASGTWSADVNHTASNTMDNGTIAFRAYTNGAMDKNIKTATMVTNNPNATISNTGNDIIITTGYIVGGQTYTYSLSAEVETNETVMVNIMNVPLSIFILIVTFAVLSAGYALVRRDNEYYTHMIASFLSAIMFGASSYMAFAGISGQGWSTGTTVPIMTLYQVPSLGYLFAGAAVIMVMYFFMRLYDIYQEHADAGWMKQ